MSSLLEFRWRERGGEKVGRRSKKQFVGRKGTEISRVARERKGEERVCVYMCTCVSLHQEEIPVFFEIKARGGNIDGNLVPIVFMS